MSEHYQRDMIQIGNLVKQFDSVKAVDSINMKVKEGEFLTLLGPSGCGKTTTLRMIAGFEEPTSGSILLNSKHVEHLPPNKRNVNTVFQNYALFPHLTIAGNVGYGLRMKKMPKDEIEIEVQKALDMVQLGEYGDRKPGQLSGGQKQRVAIARALVNKPKVLLLDEPLGALDLKLRKQMQLELKHLQQQLNITFVYVTHDQEEALTMSDRIAIMNAGKIEQIGTSEEIYETPASKFVADFIGETNLFEGHVSGKIDDTTYEVDTELGNLVVNHSRLNIGESIYISVRPENIEINEKTTENKTVIEGHYKEAVYIGSIKKHIIALKSGKELFVTGFTNQFQGASSGESVILSWENHRSVAIPGGKAV